MSSSAACLESVSAIVFRTFLDDKVHILRSFALARCAKNHLTLGVGRSPETQVQASSQPCSCSPSVPVGLGAEGADTAHIVDLRDPPQRELRSLEKLLELDLYILSSNHRSFLAAVAQKLLRMPQRLQHELLWQRDLRGDLGLPRCHSFVLVVHRTSLEVVLLTLRWIAQGCVGGVDESNLLFCLVSVRRILVGMPFQDQPSVRLLDVVILGIFTDLKKRIEVDDAFARHRAQCRKLTN
mmetsp:Transcript_35523/g.75759  ORF Transcript_35523/g.75759 Transcript_35523/m.75759 type:complete len:239 (+) Transcript_35523:246-962(+)